MNILSGQVGQWQIRWIQRPSGLSGVAKIEIVSLTSPNKKPILAEAQWRRTIAGLWIELNQIHEDKSGSTVESNTIESALFHGPKEFILERQITETGQSEWRIEGTGVHAEGVEWITEQSLRDKQSRSTSVAKEIKMKSQMPGKVVRVLVEPGQSIEKGDGLIVLEAMKMENEIRAPQDGVIKSISVQPGQAVETGAELLRLGPKTSE